MNGGTCTNLQGSFECSCATGYSGERCEENIDDCVGVSCDVPNTMCVDGVNEYRCMCQPGYYGECLSLHLPVVHFDWMHGIEGLDA